MLPIFIKGSRRLPLIACGRRPQVVASEYEGYRCRVNAAEGRR